MSYDRKHTAQRVTAFLGKRRCIKLPAAQIIKLKLILTLLHNAKHVDDVNFPGSGLHTLKGGLTGFWAIKVSGNYRIIFRFVDENILDIDYVDYH